MYVAIARVCVRVCGVAAWVLRMRGALRFLFTAPHCAAYVDISSMDPRGELRSASPAVRRASSLVHLGRMRVIAAKQRGRR